MGSIFQSRWGMWAHISLSETRIWALYSNASVRYGPIFLCQRLGYEPYIPKPVWDMGPYFYVRVWDMGPYFYVRDKIWAPYSKASGGWWAHIPWSQVKGCRVKNYSFHHSHNTQIRFMNSQKRNCAASFLISTFILSSLGRYVFGSEISYNKAPPPPCLG